ncbi:MAG: glutamine-hydrolyzing GMP synthase [Bacteroidetes bacterium]|jgi:GMP synthase (glutamine-hydrolysing)|nr:glutamine-hydrolyzing GMP synthase [Bacteroidota bacterium]
MDKILILDFGAQYTQLIARRVRELNVLSLVENFDFPYEKVMELNPRGIILSGGPSSVYQPGAPLPDKRVLESGIPVLGICYGLQIVAHLLGGEVDRSTHQEFGKALLIVDDSSDLLAGVGDVTKVWMSHADKVTILPPGFKPIAHTDNSPVAALSSKQKKIFGVQFHPEVVHTAKGKEILANFVFKVCGCTGDWQPGNFISEKVAEIREMVGTEKVICAMSGGVDSAVAAVLIQRAIGNQLHVVHIDNGLMRKDESRKVVDYFKTNFKMNLHHVDATETFLRKLRGVADPEKKRKIIGNTFIEVFEKVAHEIKGVQFLAQGTLYPDVIESQSHKGPSAKIKTHHNVGGLPEVMKLQLIEPFRLLFKDEVRMVGRELGISDDVIGRHPFPGPGLAVRVLGEITPEKLEILREADDIFIDEIRKYGIYGSIWQAFAVLLPVQSVGVMGDERTYEYTIALRAVTSEDGMTADWAQVPFELLARVSSRIINEVRGVNRVVYDISSKPPATIEWE